MQRNGFKENVPPAAADDGGLFSKLGSHDDKRKQLMEERKREYNEKMSGVSNKDQWMNFISVTNEA